MPKPFKVFSAFVVAIAVSCVVVLSTISRHADAAEGCDSPFTFLLVDWASQSLESDACNALERALSGLAMKLFYPLLFFVVFGSVLERAQAQQQPNPPGFIVQPGGTTPPDETAAQMQLPPGFKANVVSAEPEIVQPIHFAFDDRGRIWVVENLSYPNFAPKGNDRIVILEDKDGDGRYEHKKLFYEGLNMGSAVEVGFGGVWVGSNPHLLFIPDRDGDDMPDGEPEVVLDGWGHEDMHEILNSFTWGPDGWLYGTHGVFTNSAVGKPGTPENERVKVNAGVWRFHPQTHKFEVFAHGTSNPWGVDWNDYGQCFITACVIPHLYHVVQGGLYQRQAGRHFNDYAYSDIQTIAKHRHWVGRGTQASRTESADTDAAGGGHAHCGALVYLGGQFPGEYRNTMFMNNIHGNRINNDSLTLQGAGYVGDFRPDFMKSRDKWYRGLAIRTGPEGSIYVSDWYDARACHQQRPHDRTNGRIYRISHGTPAATQPFDLGKLDDAALVKLLLHENDWWVRHASRVLQERGGNPAVHAALRTMLAQADLAVPKRLRALWALHVTMGIDEALTLQLMQDGSEWLRAWSIQFACESGAPSQAVLARMAVLASDDPSPWVRLYLASAAQRLPVEQRWALLTPLSAHAEDAKEHNLPMLLWLAAEPAVAADPVRATALLTASKLPKFQEFIARRMTQR